MNTRQVAPPSLLVQASRGGLASNLSAPFYSTNSGLSTKYGCVAALSTEEQTSYVGWASAHQWGKPAIVWAGKPHPTLLAINS